MANLLNDYKYDGAQVPMAEVRVLHGACGTQIRAIRTDTFKIFTPGLRENAERILSIAPVTETYGSHARHKVDIYQSQAHNTGGEPIMIFLYAGGFNRGNRKLEVVPDGLVYNNLGTYFASRGITTLVPDYRRVDGKKVGDGALYPSGGEDISLLLKWLATSNLVGRGHRDVYFLGNSAGAIHVATYLLDPQFHEGRSQYFETGRGIVQGALNAVGGGRNLTIQGAILLGLPGDYEGHVKARKEHSNTYYGSEDKASELSPSGLLSAFSKLSSVPTISTLAIPHLLVLTAEYDPHDEIVKPTETFVHKFRELFPNETNAIQYKVLKGHNHISPIAALMSGDQMGEEWAEQLVTWILGTNHHVVDKAAKEILRGPKKIHQEDTATITVTDRTGKHAGGIDDKDDAGVTKEERTDLNREGDVGNTGKRETQPKEIQPREHITPQDNA